MNISECSPVSNTSIVELNCSANGDPVSLVDMAFSFNIMFRGGVVNISGCNVVVRDSIFHKNTAVRIGEAIRAAVRISHSF